MNFSGPVIDLPSEMQIEWPSIEFKQLISDYYDALPHITEAHVGGNVKQIICRQAVLNY